MYITPIVILSIICFILLKREYSRKLTEESFLSIVNHAFRTPLTRIKWMSDSLGEDLPRKEQLETAKNLSNSINRLLEIVDILTGIKNIQDTSSYDLKAISVREILEQSLKKYSDSLHEKNISLKFPAMVNLPLLSIDTKKISFLFDVLIENAIWYNRAGGSIDIEYELRKNKLIISISDEGIGLSSTDKNNLFSRFYRGDRAKKMNTDGMGLGLYAAKEIIKRHKGKIYATSKGLDRGATFYVELPR